MQGGNGFTEMPGAVMPIPIISSPGPSGGKPPRWRGLLRALAWLRREPLLFLILPVGTLSVVSYIYAYYHQWLGPGLRLAKPPLPAWDYVTHGETGYAFELVTAVLIALQVRWIGKVTAAQRSGHYSASMFFGQWIEECFRSPLFVWIILFLSQSVSISFFDLSLNKATAPQYAVICAIFGWSVTGTNRALRWLSKKFLSIFSDDSKSDGD